MVDVRSSIFYVLGLLLLSLGIVTWWEPSLGWNTILTIGSLLCGLFLILMMDFYLTLFLVENNRTYLTFLPLGTHGFLVFLGFTQSSWQFVGLGVVGLLFYLGGWVTTKLLTLTDRVRPGSELQEFLVTLLVVRLCFLVLRHMDILSFGLSLVLVLPTSFLVYRIIVVRYWKVVDSACKTWVQNSSWLKDLDRDLANQLQTHRNLVTGLYTLVYTLCTPIYLGLVYLILNQGFWVLFSLLVVRILVKMVSQWVAPHMLYMGQTLKTMQELGEKYPELAKKVGTASVAGLGIYETAQGLDHIGGQVRQGTKDGVEASEKTLRIHEQILAQEEAKPNPNQAAVDSLQAYVREDRVDCLERLAKAKKQADQTNLEIGIDHLLRKPSATHGPSEAPVYKLEEVEDH